MSITINAVVRILDVKRAIRRAQLVGSSCLGIESDGDRLRIFATSGGAQGIVAFSASIPVAPATASHECCHVDAGEFEMLIRRLGSRQNKNSIRYRYVEFEWAESALWVSVAGTATAGSLRPFSRVGRCWPGGVYLQNLQVSRCELIDGLQAFGEGAHSIGVELSARYLILWGHVGGRVVTLKNSQTVEVGYENLIHSVYNPRSQACYLRTRETAEVLKALRGRTVLVGLTRNLADESKRDCSIQATDSVGTISEYRIACV